MPRHNTEKSKDFKKTTIRLFKSLNNWKYLLIVSILLALFGAALSTIAPNKLSDVTNVIQDGIKPDTEKFKEVSENIIKNAMTNSIKNEIVLSNPNNIIESINNLDVDTKMLILPEIEINKIKVSTLDQISFMQTIETLNSETSLNKLNSLPESIKKIIEPKLDTKELEKRAMILAVI